MELIEYLEKLELHENKKEWEELLKVSEEAVKNFPYSQTLKIYRIKALIEKERLNEAKLLCEELIRVNPGSFIVHSLLAKIHEKKGDYKKAIDEYNKILFLNPGDDNSEKEIERLKKLLKGEKLEESFDKKTELDKTEPEIESEEKVETEKIINNEEKEESIEFKVEEEIFLEEGDKNKEVKEKEVERKETLEYKKEEKKQEEEKEEIFSEEIEKGKEESQAKLATETFHDKTKGEELKREYFEETDKDFQENQKDRKEEKFDENLYSTISMAKILEDQEKFRESQKIFLKIYKNDFSETAKKGYQRIGLKIYRKYLERLGRRLKEIV